jgi:hypothetical protein
MTHALTRTSLKGEGQRFIGRCAKCGKEGLDVGAALEECPADLLVSDEKAILEFLAKENGG